MRKQSFTIALSAIFFMAIAFIACTKSAPINTTQKAVTKITRGVVSAEPELGCCIVKYRIYSTCKTLCFTELEYAWGDPANMGLFPQYPFGKVSVTPVLTASGMAYDFELCAPDGYHTGIALNNFSSDCKGCSFILVSIDASGNEVSVGSLVQSILTPNSKINLGVEFIHRC
jgi:hypothetical protein